MNCTITNIEGRPKPWRVRYQEQGRHRTKHFAQEHDAREWASLQGERTEAQDITHEEKLLIQWAREKCRQSGTDMEATIKEFLQVAPRDTSVSLDHAVAEYKLELDRRNLRTAYIDNASYVLDRFIEDRKSWPVGSITPESVVNYCLTATIGDDNQDTTRRRIITFLN